jgi:macrolide-specific efflux system membrane fusion protein
MRTVPAGVRAGQTTTVTVVAKRATNVLYVPSAAVTSLGGRSTITVKSSGGTKPVDVTVGLKGDTTTEVSGTGVTEGAQVVIATTSTSGTNGFPGGAVPGGLGGFTGGGPGTNR